MSKEINYSHINYNRKKPKSQKFQWKTHNMQNLLKSKVNNPKQKTKNQIRLNNTPLRFNENSKIIETQSIKNSCINQYRKHNIFNKLSHLS